MTVCKHPRDRRVLDHGYDVVCDDCGQIVGRVALFPCAVLTAQQAEAALEGFHGHAGRDAKAVLEHALATPRPGPKTRRVDRKEKASSPASS